MTRSLRIVSLNAWGGAVWSALQPWIGSIAADVLCLQEVIRAPEPSPDWLQYQDSNRHLDQRADLFADVSACLPGYQSSFAPAARGPLRDAEGRVYRSEHGLGVWVAPHLAVSAQASAFIHGTFRSDGWGAEPVPRAMQMLRIADGDTGRAMVIAHLHGLRDPSGKGETPERDRQADAIVAALTAFAAPEDRMVLAGDFNLLPGSATFDLLARIGLADLVTGRGITDTRTRLYKKPQRHANYMLVRDNAEVLAFDAPAEPVVSDHRALVLDTVL